MLRRVNPDSEEEAKILNRIPYSWQEISLESFKWLLLTETNPLLKLE
jgi:hypothetical protein